MNVVEMFVSPHLGGAAQVALATQRHLMSISGISCTALVPPGGSAEVAVLATGVNYQPYNVDSLLWRTRAHRALENVRLASILPKTEKTVLHVHSPFVFRAAGSAFRWRRARTVVHMHLDYSMEELRWSLKHAPDLIIACAEFMRGNIETVFAERALKQPRIVVIRNAVDLSRFKPAIKSEAKRTLGADPRLPLVVMTATLAPHKGQETAVRAIGKLVEWGTPARLWLVGAERGHGFRERLERLARELGVAEYIRFCGFRSDIPELMAASDFLLLPSTSEGLPLAVLEAQACGAIVLAAPTAGVPEVVKDGKTGYLIAADDAGGYARRLQQLIAREDLRGEIAIAARAVVASEHSIDAYGRSISEAFSFDWLR